MLRRPYLPRIEKAAKWLLTLGVWLGALRALRSLELRLPADHFLQHVIPLGTGLALLGGVIFLAFQSSAWSEKAARSIQEYRDRRAGTIHRAITSGGSPAEALRNSYYLYLRSFASTAHVKVVLKAWTQKRGALDPGLIDRTKIQGFGTSTVYRRYAVWGDLETLLADRLERSGSELVTLGRPGEQVGAGRIVTSEEEWQKDILALARAAKGVLLLPASTEGTAWEIGQVLGDADLLTRTLFLIPPEISLLGEPGTMGGWFEPGAAVARTAFTRSDDPGLDAGRLRTVLGNEEAGELLRDLSTLGADVPGELRASAVRALEAHGIKLLQVPPEGGVLRITADGAATTVEPLLTYQRSLSLNPARFDQKSVALVGLDRAGLFDQSR